MRASPTLEACSLPREPARSISLATRLIVGLLAVIAVCFGAFGVITVRLRSDAMMREAAREVRDHGTALQVALDEFLRDHHVAEMSAMAENLARADRIEGVLIFDRFGQLADSSRSVTRFRDALAGLAQRTRATRAAGGEFRVLDRQEVFAYAFPLGRDTAAGPRGVAIVLRDLGYIRGHVRGFARELALGCLGVMAAVALGAWLAMRTTVLRPLSGLLRSVERVADGDLDAEIEPERSDEMGRLATAFNRMLGSLRTARDAIETASEANVALERRLHHAQRLALIGQLAANVAHQIGSPLNVILGRARYALKQGGQSPRDARHLEQIVRGAESISGVIERLLSQARRVRGPAERVDLGQLAHETVRFVESECERRGISTAVESAPGVCVLACRDELGQLILNLCVNAIQAQPRGGRLELRVRKLTDRGALSAELIVVDAGPGVSPALREKIFEPFFTTKPALEGTGLGLAICDEIVRRQGGAIALLDAPGRGATFRVRLPACVG